jgi:hypothetical protein
MEYLGLIFIDPCKDHQLVAVGITSEYEEGVILLSGPKEVSPAQDRDQ